MFNLLLQLQTALAFVSLKIVGFSTRVLYDLRRIYRNYAFADMRFFLHYKGQTLLRATVKKLRTWLENGKTLIFYDVEKAKGKWEKMRS